MNSLQFLPLKDEFFQGKIFAIFTFLGFFLGEKGQEITLVTVNSLKFLFFHSLRMKSLHFSPFKDEFFTIFTLKDEFFTIFTLKGEFFLIFTL